MTIEQFTAAIRAQPFRPFILHAASGKEFRVNHPEMASRTPAGRTLAIADGDDAFAIVDLLLIEAITYQNATEKVMGERNS